MNQQDNPEPNQNQNLDQSSVSGQVGQGRDFKQFQNSSGNQIAGRDINIHNHPEPIQPIPPETKRDIQNRHKLINNIKSEIADRLEQSLHNINPINLHKEKQPQQVQRFWDVDLKTGKSGATLPPETTIIDVFDQKAISGRLLILGAPGSGKTTALLELAEVLVERAEQNPGFPVPVLFSLASWQKDGQSMAEWMVAQLNERQGVSEKLSQEWLEKGQLLPLLDGLDELKSERQEGCVRAINQFIRDCRPQHLGVCSRLEEYERCPTKLELQGAVCLLPLTEGQIREYLRRTDCVEFWPHLQQDSNLLELAKTPLFLNVIALAYSEIALDQWQCLESFEMRQQYLFDAYLERMLKRNISERWYRRGKEPSGEQTKHWLRFLAQQLKTEERTEFFIEKMQPTWLKSRRQRRIYGLIFGLIYGLVFGLVFGLTGGLLFGLTVGLTVGLIGWPIVGLILGLIGEQIDDIQLMETFELSWTQATRKKLIAELIAGLIAGLMYGLMFGLIFGLIVGLTVGLIAGLIAGPIFGLIAGLIYGLKVDIRSRTQPNQGIWQSAKNTLAIVLITLPMWTMFWVFLEYIDQKSLSITKAIALGLDMAYVISIVLSGPGCIQHFALRFVLWFNGSIPWNYARFLNYATERLLLQRVGGGYRFMHDLLREHFATQV